jgi:hypothetical protein
MTSSPNDITLVAHKSKSWSGTTELYTAQDGWLLALGRDPLVDAAKRLRQEGFADNVMVIVRDADGIAPDRCGKIGDLLR